MRENKGKLKQMKNSFARPANSCEVHTTSEVLFFQIKEKLCSCAELNVCQFVLGQIFRSFSSNFKLSTQRHVSTVRSRIHLDGAVRPR